MSDNPEFDDLENLLREAPLRRPSAKLDERIFALTRSPHRVSQWPRAWTVPLSMAAALALAAGSFWAFKHFSAPHPPVVQVTPPISALSALTPAPRANVKPMSLVRTISNITDDGIIGTAQGVPVRRYRRQSIEHVVMRDSNGRNVAFSVPREEILVVRVRAF